MSHGKRLLESPTTSPPKHRIYEGSPAKIKSPRRIFEMAKREGTKVWKARHVSREEDLQAGEDFITHRRILDETDCSNTLVKLGVSKAVLVSEGLGFLSELMDIHFESLSNMAMYQVDVQTIMSSIKSSQGKRTFSRFAHALYNGCEEDGEVYEAIVRSGMGLFWDVIEAAAGDNPENDSLKAMSSVDGRDAEFQTLKGWSNVFVLLEERHQRSHPFKFIKGDIDLTEAAFEVFKFISTESKDEKFNEVLQIMLAAIPIVAKKIAEKKLQVVQAKTREATKDEMVRNRLPLRSL